MFPKHDQKLRISDLERLRIILKVENAVKPVKGGPNRSTVAELRPAQSLMWIERKKQNNEGLPWKNRTERMSKGVGEEGKWEKRG